MGDRPVPGKGRVRPEPRGRSRIHRATGGPSCAREHSDRANREVPSELSGGRRGPPRLLGGWGWGTNVAPFTTRVTRLPNGLPPAVQPYSSIVSSPSTSAQHP